MFTGLVQEIGKIVSIRPNAEGKEIVVSSKELLPEISIDDSVSINGACQTATSLSPTTFTVQAVHVSLKKTSLGSLKVGDEVNLELATRPIDRLGGHIVQGHVNDIAQIKRIKNIGNNYQLTVGISQNYMKYIVSEGSITIDGISLTVASVDKSENTFTLSIIPHTWSNTILRNRVVGHVVNVEVDIIAKYVENLLFYGQSSMNSNGSKASGMSEEWLRSKGF